MKLILTILSWSWIAFGIWWFFRPAGIRKRLEKQYRRSVRRILLVVFFAVAGLVFAAGREFGGIFGWFLIILACVALIKGLFLLNAKVSDRLMEEWGRQPDSVYRIAAAVLVALGCVVQWYVRATSSG